MLRETEGVKLRGGAMVGGNRDKKARYLYASQFTGGKKVLDVGCGCGWGLFQIVDEIESAVAVDKYGDPVAYARLRFRSKPKVRVEKADAQELPFLDKSFDVTLCFDVIEHVEDPEACLKQIQRVTRELALFTTPDRKFYGRPKNPDHRRHYTRDELEKLLLKYFNNAKYIPPKGSGIKGTLFFVCGGMKR